MSDFGALKPAIGMSHSYSPGAQAHDGCDTHSYSGFACTVLSPVLHPDQEHVYGYAEKQTDQGRVDAETYRKDLKVLTRDDYFLFPHEGGIISIKSFSTRNQFDSRML
jgi:hypothetical protein